MAVEIPSPLAAQPQGAGEGVAAAVSSHPCCRQKPCLLWRCVPGVIGEGKKDRGNRPCCSGASRSLSLCVSFRLTGHSPSTMAALWRIHRHMR